MKSTFIFATLQIAKLLAKSTGLGFDFDDLGIPVIKGARCPAGIVPSNNVTAEHITNYLGTWWTAADTPFLFSKPTDICTSATYTPNNLSEGRVNVDNAATRQRKSGRYYRKHAYGQALYLSPGNLFVQFPGSPFYPPEAEYVPDGELGNYIVLQSDAENQEYAYIYSCGDYCSDETDVSTCSYRPIFWINVREQSNNAFGVPTVDRIEAALEIFYQGGASENAVEIMRGYFTQHNLNNCDEIVKD